MGLLTGRTAHILFYAYLSKHTKNEKYFDKALERIDEVYALFDQYKDKHDVYSYGGGVLGLAWVLRLLHKEGMISVDIDDVLEDIDGVVDDFLNKDLKNHKYDPLYGYVSKGIYLLERVPEQRAVDGLARIVDTLVKEAIPVGSYLTWHNKEKDLLVPTIEGSPRWCDCGIAHGTSGIILLLCAIYEKGLFRDRITPLIQKAVGWLLSVEDTEEHAIFKMPYFVTYPAINTSTSSTTKAYKLAWCYGDLSIAWTLTKAAKTLDCESWLAAAHKLALSCASVPIQDSGVVKEDGTIDPTFCHGAIGVAYLLNKINGYFHDDKMASAIHQWKEIAIRETGECLTHKNLICNLEGLKEDCGLLYGYSGIGLALMGLMDSELTGWDGALLLN